MLFTSNKINSWNKLFANQAMIDYNYAQLL